MSSSQTGSDVIVTMVVWRRLLDIVEEMGTALRQTAYSAGIREAEDCATALFDRRGRLLANAVFTPGMIGSMPLALANVLERMERTEMRAGDGIVMNDPYLGNGHLPDIFCFSP